MNNPSIRLGDNSIQIDPSALWMEIMTRRIVAQTIKIGMHVLVNCFVSLGTKLLLDEENINLTISGLLSMTVLHVESMSRGAVYDLDFPFSKTRTVGRLRARNDESLPQTKWLHLLGGNV